MASSEAITGAGLTGLGNTPRGPWRLAWERFARHRAALVALVVLGIVLAGAVVTAVPTFERHEASTQHLEEEQVHAGPSGEFWLGTDNLGRDLWARAWEGVRISLRVAVASQAVVLLLGVTVGLVAAMGGRWADGAMMRLTDLTYAFPDLLAIILLRSVLLDRDWPIIGSGDPQIPGFPGPLLQVTLAIGLVAWATLARLMRGQLLQLRGREYVLAAEAMGASRARIVTRHMLPNAMGPVVIAITVGIPLAIFAEAVLGFIGFGLPPPTASLGTLVSDGYVYFRQNSWALLVPAGAIAILTLCFTFIGDGLREAMDPR